MRRFDFASYDEMSARAAAEVAAVVVSKPDAVVGLATGSTPVGLYKKLIEWCAAGLVDFSRVHTVNLDEYVGLPVAAPQSYRRFMDDNLFDHINIDKANTNVPNGMAADIAAECARYDALIAGLGGVDVQVLGLGHDGHIGFNEPADCFSLGTNCVRLTDETIAANTRFFNNSGEVPKSAVTMGMREIIQAKKIVFVVNGGEKRDILERAVCGPVTPRVPASLLQLHPDVTLLYSAE